MKYLTHLTCPLIVACIVAAINPFGTKQAGNRFLINDTTDLAEERNNFP